MLFAYVPKHLLTYERRNEFGCQTNLTYNETR